MKHEITIKVSKPKNDKIVSCKVMKADSKHLDQILNSKKVTIIVPGDSVTGIKIKEISDGECDHA